MRTLDLDCPSCGETLELDAGFAGGVCRCSNCGTLMTVPRDAGRAEKLTSAPARSASPNDEIDPDDLEPANPPRPSPRTAGTKRGKSKRGKGKAKRGAARAETIDAGEYRTASGKVVQVEAPMRVPLAESKRKQVRIVTTVVFMSVILCIAAIAAYAIWSMVSGDDNPTANGGENNAPAQAQYDPNANPFTLDHPNIAGLPLNGNVAIVIEATERDSVLWMPQAAELIRAGINRPGPSANITLTAAAKGGPKTFGTGKPTAVNQIKEDQLRQWINGLSYGKTVDRPAAISAALSTKPDMLILIFSDASDKDVERWAQMVKAQPGLIVHGVMIDSANPRSAMHLWLRDRPDSEGVSISSNDIKRWQIDAETGG